MTRERVGELIGEISAASNLGAIQACLINGVRGRRDLVSFKRIKRCLDAHGVTLDEETRTVLGVEQALRLRRVRPTSITDWRLLIGWAIDEGLTFEAGWKERWHELNSRVRWLGYYHGSVGAHRALGFSLADVVGDRLERRGLPVVLPTVRVGLGRDSRLQACLDALRDAAADAPAGRLSLAKIETALDTRDDCPTAAQLIKRLSSCGLPKETALRLALGRKEALLSGRVVARTRTEWVTVLAAAIGDGYTPGPGWRRRWNTLRAAHPHYVSSWALEQGGKAHGGLDALYAAAEHERAARHDSHEPHVRAAPAPGSARVNRQTRSAGARR